MPRKNPPQERSKNETERLAFKGIKLALNLGINKRDLWTLKTFLNGIKDKTELRTLHDASKSLTYFLFHRIEEEEELDRIKGKRK